MKLAQIFDRLDPAKLENHPLSHQIYHDGPSDELLESVKEHGILDPLILAADKKTIVSGHSRRVCAMKLKLKQVPVLIRADLTDSLDIRAAVIHANRQREKTPEQRAREYAALKEIEAERATKNSAQNLKKGKNAENLPTSKILPVGTGTREVASQMVGWSGPTAARAAEVVDEIDRAEKAGDTQRAEDLRQTLNGKSVAAAHAKLKPPAKETKAAIVKDTLDRDVPESLHESYELTVLILKAANQLDQVKHAIKELATKPGGQFLESSILEVDLKKLKHAIRSARYYTTCPHCDGKKCKRCKHGWLPFSMKGKLTAEEQEAIGQ